MDLLKISYLGYMLKKGHTICVTNYYIYENITQKINKAFVLNSLLLLEVLQNAYSA